MFNVLGVFSRIFSSLRSRLLASYVIVLLLTLAIMAVALLILLQARPVPSELATDRLISALQTTLNNLEASGTVIPPDGPTRLEARGLSRYANQTALRILITDSSGKVSYDSKNYDLKLIYDQKGFNTGDQVTFVQQPYTNVTAPDAFARGTFDDTKGNTWIYVGQPPSSSDPQSQRLTFAVSAPRTTAAALVRYYGPDILAPVFEAGLIGLIIAFVFSVLIARSVTRPLQRVAETAAAIAQGHLDRKAPVSGPREVRLLAVAFNQMTEEVAASQEAQRDFLANVSHDLRTPLTSIRGFSQAIIDGVASNPQSALRAATIIHDEAARMYRMVEELLDLARIEAGRIAMTRHGVRIGEVLSAISERLAPSAQERGLTLVTELNAPLPVIGGDGDRLAQVFINLIDNALKHTPSGGTVTLCGQMQDNGVLVTVHDTGEGIPAADLPRVFDRFYQVDKSRQRREGAGLGLAITQQIVAAHGGRIWVESVEGAWTRFSVWLPLPNADSSTIMRRRADLKPGAQ